MSKQVSNPTDSQLFLFWADEMAPELQEKYNPETTEGLTAILSLYHASLAGGTKVEKDKGARKERTAREYSTFLIVRGSNKDEARMLHIGTGLGSIGRESNDPTQWSVSRQLKQRAEVKALRANRFGDAELGIEKGTRIEVLTLPTEDVAAFFM